MKGVILDRNSFDKGDLQTDCLELNNISWSSYPSTLAEQTVSRIHQANIVITNKVLLDKNAIENSPDLKLVLVAATGTDNVDLTACREKGIDVCNVRNYSTPAVAQHTIGLMLNLMTNQHRYFEEVKTGNWSEHDVFCMINHPIMELQDKNLGVIGYGTLGKKVAEIATAFGMNILICQRPGNTDIDSDRVAFRDVLAQSDIITLHCPLTDDTHRLFSHNEFRQMKNSAYLINTARGAIIDSGALIQALKTNEISGAAIDVLDKEPPPANHDLLQNSMPNLIVTPHNAWASQESRQRLVNLLVENLEHWLDGKPLNLVN